MKASHSTARVWNRLPEAGRRVALTFDDCDDEEAWGRILDVLSSHHALASFFPNGFRAEAAPALAALAVAERHTVGSHGWDHRALPGLPRAEIRRRLEADRRLWERIAGISIRLLRPPFGAYDERVGEATAEAGYTDLVLWDVDPADWRIRDARRITGRILRAAGPGSIVLLHVLDATADALPDVIDGLRASGLEPATLDVLLPGRPLDAGANRQPGGAV